VSVGARLAACNPAVDAAALLGSIGRDAPPFTSLRW
jgi:hypothetical protein